MDPPTQARYNSDFASIQLPSNSTLAACSDLCCSTPSCVAFSYNTPQPIKTCVGGKCCAEGSVCCMLKNGWGTLEPNPFPPGQVTTGVVVEPAPWAPGPTPPFPPSPLILNVSFGPVGFWSDTQGGDTWPSAWASDGSTYGWDCDAHGSPMSLWRLPPTPFNVTPTLVGDVQAIDYTHLCAPYGPTGSFPKVNVKPSGMVALGSGMLIAGISCMEYGDDPAFNRQHNLGGFLATSEDFGVSWRNATPVGTLFKGRLSAPAFVSCGQANAPCSAKDGGWLYVFFPGSVDDESYWDNNDGVWLGRVPEGDPTNTSAYEFFGGMGGGNAPRWTSDPRQAEPTLSFPLMVGENPVMWIPPLDRYIFCNFGFIDHAGNPRPWHTEPYMMPHVSVCGGGGFGEGRWDGIDCCLCNFFHPLITHTHTHTHFHMHTHKHTPHTTADPTGDARISHSMGTMEHVLPLR